MTTEQAVNADEAIVALANRYPLLLMDLQGWVQANPASARVGREVREPIEWREGEREVLWNDLNPAGVLERLGCREGQVLHIFPEVAGFLQFLGRPGAGACIAHERWAPLLCLPLERSAHFRQWLAGTAPRSWPWSLLKGGMIPEGEVALVARRTGEQMLGMLGRMTSELCKRVGERYRGRATAAEVMREGVRALRVLLWAYEGSVYHQYCARDIAAGMEARGAEARCVISVMGPARDYELLEAVEGFDPDVVLLNGRGRSDASVLPPELCILTWDQDYCVCYSAFHAQKAGPRDVLMLMVADWREDAALAGFDRARTAHVNLGTNHRMYHPGGVGEAVEYDVLFVGNIHPFEEYRRLIRFDELDETTQVILLRARERLGDWLRSRGEEEAYVIPDCDRFLREVVSELGLGAPAEDGNWRQMVNYFRYRIAHLLVREAYVSSLREFRLGLFGRGWEKFPALAGQARREVGNGKPLLDAIHRAAISLHLHTWTVHHPRLYDTAAAGGFLLVGRVPEAYPLERAFLPGEELDTFGSIGELKRKIRRYLADPEARMAMGRRAAERVRREHTMEHRVVEMMKLLGEGCHDQ